MVHQQQTAVIDIISSWNRTGAWFAAVEGVRVADDVSKRDPSQSPTVWMPRA
jgi:hypothetical protein